MKRNIKLFSNTDFDGYGCEYVFLMNSLKVKATHINDDNIKVNVLGRVNDLPKDLQSEINKAIDRTKNNTGVTFNIALNYGGRAEIVRAAKEIAREINSGKEFTYNGKKVNYAVCGNSDYNQPLFILGYDNIREEQCFMNHGYVPYIIGNEIKFLKKDEYFTFE